MAVTARFYIQRIVKFANGGYAEPKPTGTVHLMPSTRGEENKVWASATPSGQITMTVRGSAFPWFEDRLGKDVHITFDDVPEPPAQG